MFSFLLILSEATENSNSNNNKYYRKMIPKFAHGYKFGATSKKVVNL